MLLSPVAAITKARELDASDPLAAYREQFAIGDPDLIYLDGNSLGRLPKRTQELTLDLVNRQWGNRLVRAWGDDWIDLPSRIGSKIAKLIGASPGEVLVCDSTSVNLFKLISAALKVRKGRSTILTSSDNFPSDIYVAQGCAEQSGHSVVIVEPDHIESSINEQLALLTLSHTAFKSGFVHPMEPLTRLAHEAGGLVLWDLCHSVGAMPIDLNGSNVDLAVGCTYKYLNGGPGAPAFLFVRKDLQEEFLNPIWGWFGQSDPFGFSLEYKPASGINRFMSGTPPIMSLAAVETGVDMILEAGIGRIRQKSILQTEFLIELWESYLSPLGVTLNSPRDPQNRGSHVSFGHFDGFRIDQALIHVMNVVPDFRYPDNIRFGVTPLSTTFVELAEAVLRTKRVIEERIYERYDFNHAGVT